MLRTFSLLFILALSLTVFAAEFAQAAIIVRPVSAVASSEFDGTRNADNTRDESGMSGSVNTGDPIPGIYPTHDTSHTTAWLSSLADSAGNPVITFDLGATYLLGGMHIWNHNETVALDRGLRNVDVSFSTTSAVAGFGPAQTFSGADEFPMASGLTSYTGDDKFFNAPVTAQWVRFTINDNWGNNYTGLSEVRFFTTDPAPIPEPSTLILAAITLGGVSLVRRRQNRG